MIGVGCQCQCQCGVVISVSVEWASWCIIGVCTREMNLPSEVQAPVWSRKSLATLDDNGTDRHWQCNAIRLRRLLLLLTG